MLRNHVEFCGLRGRVPAILFGDRSLPDLMLLVSVTYTAVCETFSFQAKSIDFVSLI